MSTEGRRDRAFPQRNHDHGRCVAEAMTEAAAVCEGSGARMTPLRRRVLQIVWRSHRPLGAYAILDALAVEGRSSAPPTVYRVLEFLLEHGLVHRIASLNAYTGCRRPGHAGTGQFLICGGCGVAAEINEPAVDRVVRRCASAEGFVAERHTIEITGLCPHCRVAG